MRKEVIKRKETGFWIVNRTTLTLEKKMRFSTSIAGIVAGIAMGFLATTSRADFNLTLLNNQGDGFTVKDVGGTITYTAIGDAPASNPFTGNATSFSGNLTIDGNNLAITATGNATSSFTGGETLTVTSTPVGSPANTTFTYNMGESLTKTSGPLTLTGSLATTTNSASNTVTGMGSYSSNSFTTSTQSLSVSSANSSSSNSTPISPGNSSTTNKLGLNGSFALGNSSNLHFTAKVSAMPEPTGVVIFAMGLPCMAGVVFLFRRRSVKMPALV